MTCPVCILVAHAAHDPEGAIAAAIGFGVICTRAAEGHGDPAIFSTICPKHQHAAPIRTRAEGRPS